MSPLCIIKSHVFKFCLLIVCFNRSDHNENNLASEYALDKCFKWCRHAIIDLALIRVCRNLAQVNRGIPVIGQKCIFLLSFNIASSFDGVSADEKLCKIAVLGPVFAYSDKRYSDYEGKL